MIPPMLVEFLNADTNKRVRVDIPAVPRIGERVSFRARDRSTLHVEVVNVGYTIREPDAPPDSAEPFATVLIR
jgi:hypothetical protein